VSERVETVIIGGGQAGLSMSYHLGQLGREHIVTNLRTVEVNTVAAQCGNEKACAFHSFGKRKAFAKICGRLWQWPGSHS